MKRIIVVGCGSIGKRHARLDTAASKNCRRDGGNTYQKDMIQPNAMERMIQSHYALEFVSVDRPRQHVSQCHGLPNHAIVILGARQDGADIVGRMSPLGR